MIIKVLLEDSLPPEEIGGDVGLSLHIETDRHKLLFDMGTYDRFTVTAAELGVNLSKVEKAFVSHGHYDHGGGLNHFFAANRTTEVYLSKYAFLECYSVFPNELQYDGLDQSLKDNEQIIFVDEMLKIDDQLTLYSAVKGDYPLSTVCGNLVKKQGDDLVPDDFAHEQSLLISEGDVNLLVVGCSHAGIVNIVKHVSKRCEKPITHLMGGFHLHSKDRNLSEDEDVVIDIANYLKQKGIICYTGHCTGEPVYKIMKTVLGDSVGYLNIKDEIVL